MLWFTEDTVKKILRNISCFARYIYSHLFLSSSWLLKCIHSDKFSISIKSFRICRLIFLFHIILCHIYVCASLATLLTEVAPP